ncbi:MAG: beta-lactamase family protein [Flavobacteriales bacterium]|nr:beta-lactamase family protein [Flavobacteriales bacterium]MBP6697689.1 beta-lactamase family protein [Flavobacteriales bacterium]
MLNAHLLFPLLIAACTAPPAIPEEKDELSAPHAALAHKCDSLLHSLVGDAYGAGVLISVHDTLILSAGYGFIDSAHRHVPTDSTLFNLASISKSFTAVCIAQLEAEGLLNRSDTLTRYFPDLPADKRWITIEHCLTHTSGLAQHYAADGTHTLDEAVTAIGRDTLDTIPGTAFRYSNENYELLAAVVEKVSGMPFEAYVRVHVLLPAGLMHTKVWSDVAHPSPPEVAAFTRAIEPEVFGVNWGYIGSGGIYSCTSDLHAWFTALRHGALLSPALLDTLWTPRVPMSVGHMARGWFVSDTKGTTEIWTRGNEDWGHNAVVRWFPERGVLIIVLTNSGEIGDKNTTGNRILGDALVEVLVR